MPALENDTGSLDPPTWTLNDDTFRGTEEIYGKDHTRSFPSLSFLPDDYIPVIEDGAWAPLDLLVRKATFLTDLVYDCPSQFSACLLEALHACHPRCKLELPQLRFRALLDPTPDPHELAIATSPNLHAISVRHVFQDPYDHDGRYDYNEDAKLRTVAGLAPNIQKLRTVLCLFTFSRSLVFNNGRLREPWTSLGLDHFPFEAAKLESLSLSGVGPVRPLELETLTKHIDFSTLRKLEIARGIDDDGLACMSSKCSLPHLRTLQLRLEPFGVPSQSAGLREGAISFLTSMPPLKSLELMGCFDRTILDAGITRHGSTLRSLNLASPDSGETNPRPVQITADVVKELQAQCPALGHLAFPIRRTKGKPPASDIYQALGTFSRLQSLFLTLDASNAALGRDYPDMTGNPDDVPFDEFDSRSYCQTQTCQNGHVRDNLMNAAIDEPLARSIWDAISANKVGRPLQSLKITTTGGICLGADRFLMSLLAHMVDHLSRSYLLTRSVRDDSDEVSVRELGERAREARGELSRDSQYKHGPRYSSPETDLEIFHRIWPVKQGSRDWREDWSSLPLQISADHDNHVSSAV